MTVDLSHRRRMTRTEALGWNPDWSVGDIRLIGEHFDRVEALTFYRTSSNGSVTAQDSEGRSVMYLYPGYVEFRKGLAPEDRPDPEWHGLALSSFRPRSATSSKGEERLSFCPSCFYALPATGICDTCD
ncbi:MAG: hypothetical protein ACTHWF_00360 [Brachybacterium sp.]|uniref:hypothetical protein n=1 Tax=Brachybacterium sp. Z12 TaxID=2759167 RepID=UPI0018608E57|nr:hypothetical protein [Brachybacterium sp. Z12]QNN81685.1 hypothetical protein H3H54_09245 [Brachybacterium sp. Z12]